MLSLDASNGLLMVSRAACLVDFVSPDVLLRAASRSDVEGVSWARLEECYREKLEKKSRLSCPVLPTFCRSCAVSQRGRNPWSGSESNKCTPQIQVEAGSEVTWVNEDDFPHNVHFFNETDETYDLPIGEERQRWLR
jgi:Copper binding proteins, plastocyanin/azurin family